MTPSERHALLLAEVAACTAAIEADGLFREKGDRVFVHPATRTRLAALKELRALEATHPDLLAPPHPETVPTPIRPARADRPPCPTECNTWKASGSCGHNQGASRAS